MNGLRQAQVTLDVPGNYPKDLCEALLLFDPIFLKGQLEMHALGQKQIIMTINLKNFGEVLDDARMEPISNFLKIFFGDVSEMIENFGGSYVNKFMGDGVLAYFGQDIEPLSLFFAVKELRNKLEVYKETFTHDIPNTNLLGMTCLLMLERSWIGAVETDKYRDFTLIGKDLFRAFRMLEWTEADTVLVSENLRPEFASDYVMVQVSPSPLRPLFFSIMRVKTEYEKKTTFLRCNEDCEWNETCQRAYSLGKNRKRLDCQDCCDHFVITQNYRKNYLCWNWEDCRDKYEQMNAFEHSNCCSVCARHHCCFHQYCLGRNSSGRIRCDKHGLPSSAAR